jgi:rhodanese-related sulfurtransferase/DNA-binding transcriptional ArsR family regulator
MEDDKTALYEQFARVGKALGAPLRLVLLDVLAQGERSVEDLARAVEAKMSNTSAQLHVLANAGLVASRRDGTRIWYRLTSDEVAELVDRVRHVAHQQLAATDWAARAYLGDSDDIEVISPDELHRRLRDRTVTVIDVRPEAEYQAGHLPDAHSMPLDDLEARLGELPAGTEVVAYCRGPYCVLAPHAVRILHRHGRAARTLTVGYPQWKRAGLPTHTGTAV